MAPPSPLSHSHLVECNPPLSLDTRNISLPPLSTLLYERCSLRSLPGYSQSTRPLTSPPLVPGGGYWKKRGSPHPSRPLSLRRTHRRPFFSRTIPHQCLHQLLLETKKTTREATTRLQGTFSVSKTPVHHSLEMSLASHKFSHVKDVAQERVLPPP